MVSSWIRKPVFWGIVFSIFTIGISLGQGKKTYQGTYRVGNLSGEADFEYLLSGSDTILDGGFSLKSSSLEALLKENDSSFSILGNFTDGVPQGKWLFQFGEFQTDSTSQVVGYQYRVNVNGNQEEIEGSLENGRPQGIWKINAKRIEDSQIADTLFHSEILFEEGVPQQSFRIATSESTLVGRFLRNGLAHDSWSLFSNDEDGTENWVFDEGRLTRIEREDEGEVISSEIFPNSFSASKTIRMDASFSTLVSLYRSKMSGTWDTSKGIIGLLLQNGQYYAKIDTLLGMFGNTGFLPEFNAVVPFHPLNETEKQQLDSILVLTKESKQITASLLASTQLNLLKRSDEDADYLHKVLARIQQEYEMPLLQLVHFNELDIVDCLNRKKLVETLFPAGTPSISIKVTPDDGEAPVFLGPDHGQFNFSGQDLESIHQIASYMRKSVEQVANQLNGKLAFDKKQQEFVDLEETLIAKANRLNQYPDSVLANLTRAQSRALKHLRRTSEQLLASYSKMEVNQEKLRRAHILISCLEDLDSLSGQILLLPRNAVEIEEKYKDAVFNPFTATIMEEAVKRRITTAYKTVLLPYLLDAVEAQVNCDNAGEMTSLFRDLHLRMLALREEDTKKLERKLRKVQDPMTVLALFDLKPLEK